MYRMYLVHTLRIHQLQDYAEMFATLGYTVWEHGSDADELSRDAGY